MVKKTYNVYFFQTIEVKVENKEEAMIEAVRIWSENPDYADPQNMDIEIEKRKDSVEDEQFEDK